MEELLSVLLCKMGISKDKIRKLIGNFFAKIYRVGNVNPFLLRGICLLSGIVH